MKRPMRQQRLSASELSSTQAASEAALESFGECPRCGAKQEPAAIDCLFCSADTERAPAMEAAEWGK